MACEHCGATFATAEGWHEHQARGFKACVEALRARLESAERALRWYVECDGERPIAREHCARYPDASKGGDSPK